MAQYERVDAMVPVGTSTLRWMHVAAAVLMSVEALVIGVMDIDVHVPQTINTVARNVSGPVGEPELKQVYTLKVVHLITVFLALAALDHTVTACVAFYWPKLFYWCVYEQCCNPLRWLEYSVSASLMSVLIAVLTGIYDVHLLCLIGALTGLCMVCGALMEMAPATPRAWLPRALFWLGSVALTLAWLPILCYFFSHTGDIPGFVYAAFLLTAVMYGLFALNMWLYRIQRRYRFDRAEYIYVLLSFVAKTFLAFDVFGGFKASEV